jgi:hypothetical protein
MKPFPPALFKSPKRLPKMDVALFKLSAVGASDLPLPVLKDTMLPASTPLLSKLATQFAGSSGR